jgi:hypothetical protein
MSEGIILEATDSFIENEEDSSMFEQQVVGTRFGSEKKEIKP